MEDLNALYKALENADAAGDVESAKALTKYIESLPTEEPAVEEPAADATQPQKDLTKASTIQPPKEPSSLARRIAGDTALGLSQGVIEGAKGFIGLADIPTMGYAGKAHDYLAKKIYGGTLSDAEQYLQSLKTPEQQIAEQKVAEAKGFTPTLKELGKNPSALLNVLEQSIPSMLGGVGIASKVEKGAQLLEANAPRIGKFLEKTAPALGEAGISGGQTAEGVREQTETGTLTPKQAAIAGASGAATGFFSVLGGKVAHLLGVENLETYLLKKVTGKAAEEAKQNAITKAVKTAINESVVEELPQSMQEQIAQNIMLGKPWDEGVAEAGATGLLTGAVMSGPIVGVSQALTNRQLDQKAKEIDLEPATEEQRGSRDTIIKSTLKDLEDKANEVNLAKEEAKSKLKSAQQQQVVSEAQDLESMAPINPMELTDITLTSWGLSKNSKAYKTLIGQDVSTPEGRALLDETLDAHTGKINEDAVETYKSLMDQQKAEAKNAGINIGTTTISNEISGGQKYGTPGGVEGRFGSAVNIGGSPIGIPQTGEKTGNGSLETNKPAEAKTTIDYTKKSPIEGFVWADTTNADGTLTSGWVRDPNATIAEEETKIEEEPKATEVIKGEEQLTETEDTKAMKKMANLLRTLDPTNPLIDTLQAGLASNDDIQEAHTTIEDLKAARKAKKVDLTKPSEEEKLLSTQEGDEQGKDIVNTTKPANTLGQALNIIKNQHFNKLNPVQRMLHSMFEKMPNVLKGTYKVMGLGKGEFGQYKAITNKTIISPDGGTETIYHEASHAATVWAVRKHVSMKNGRPVAKTAIGQQLVDIFDAAEVAAMQEEKDFGDAFKNMEEFVSYAYNNIEFQKFLADQRSVAPTAAPKTSLWMDLMNAFTKLLGVDIANTLMSDIVSLTPELMTGERPGIISRLAQPVETLYHKINKEKLDEQLEASGSKYKAKVEPPSIKDNLMAHPLQTVGDIVRNFRKSAFSFDHAINQKIMAAMRKAGVSIEDFAKSFYQMQISQAVKSDQMADLFMIHGNLVYDNAAFKFITQDVKDSMVSIRNSLSALATKYGISEAKMYEYASAAFIARRSQSLINANKALKKVVLKLLIDGKKAQAHALMKRQYKLVHLTPAQIKAGEKFFDDFKDTRGRSELEKIFNAWNNNRARVLNFAQKEGLYSEEDIEDLLNVMDYVPFYRDAQIEAGKGPKEYARGLLDAATDKRLKGSYQPVNNVFDNMERWTRYIIRKSINNRAAKEKIALYSKWLPDDIKILRGKERSKTGNIVNVWQNGKLVKYEFQGTDGESMVDGFTGLEPVTTPFFRGIFRPFANFLRLNIVLQPVFSIAQIPMDAYNAMFTSRVKYPLAIPLQVLKEIMLTPFGQSSARNYLKRTGTVGKHDFSSEYERIDIEAMHEAKKAGSLTKLLKLIAHPFGMLAMASDNIIRQAVYSQVLLETKDKARAVHMAEEIINFRRTGSSGIVNILRQNAPFVNANLQSLHIAFSTLLEEGIGPDTKSEAYKRLITTGVQMFVLAMIYAALNANDDKYKELDPSERDRYLIIPGSNGFKLPLRNDIITLLFKTLPEHLVNRFILESEDSTKLLHALEVGLTRAIAMPSGIPTLITPAVEMAYNIDLNTGRPLIGRGQENLEEDLQYSNKYTNQLSRAIGDASGVSPALIQHFFDRYFGTTSLLMGMITNGLVAGMRGEVLPEKTVRDYLLQIPSMGMFVTREHGARNIDDYYELNEMVTKIVASSKKYQSLDYEKYKEYLKKDHNAEMINMQKELAAISKELQTLRTYENQIYASKDTAKWTPTSKKAELERLEKMRQEMLGHQLKIKERSDRYIEQMRLRGGL